MALSTPAIAVDLEAMSESDQALFGELVRDYLVNNPEVIMEAIQILQERQATAEEQSEIALISENIEEIQNDGFSWVGGNPDGDITLVEFVDYKCHYCRKAHDDVVALVKADGNIRLVVKEYPILSQDSLISSQAAIAALQSQGSDAYKKMYNSLIKFDGPVNDKSIAFIANKAGLDGDKIVAQMQEPAVAQHIARTRQLGETLQVSGTPTFLFNDQIVRGYVPKDAMEQIIAELRANTQ
ncbi:DsbA family protein [Amylibacter sp. SFDW26]|nr:DsbA family protein [Amylibacter sp. SFDW26]